MLSVDQVEQLLNVWNFPLNPGALIPGPWHWGHIGSFPIDVDGKTMAMTWFTMAVVGTFAVVATRNMDAKKPSKIQNMFEMMYEGIRNTAYQTMDPVKAAPLLSVVVTYFIFILFSNMIGLIPTLSSPMADYQTTFAMALVTFFLIHYFGFRYKGRHYWLHFLKPFWFFLPLTIIEEATKPVTLGLRLYGNIFAGEMMIMVFLSLLGGWVHLAGGFVISVVWLAFSIFIGFIQSFIFAALTIAYVGIAVSDSD